MARKSLIARQDKRQKLADKYAELRAKYKAEGNWDALHTLPRNSSPVRQRLRCAVTGRPRGNYRKFGLCRNMFRLMALEGKIPGVRKSSW